MVKKRYLNQIISNISYSYGSDIDRNNGRNVVEFYFGIHGNLRLIYHLTLFLKWYTPWYRAALLKYTEDDQ